MDYLKSVFGDEALTFAQLCEKLKDNKEVKLANLASGQYVDKEKLDTKITELATANKKIGEYETTITGLQTKAGDAETIATELATLRGQIEADNTARAQETERAKLVERFKAANGEKKFLNDLTEKGVCDSFLSALSDEANKGKSDADILATLTQDKGYYQSQNPPGNINVPGQVENPTAAEDFKKRFDSAKASGNRAEMSAIIREAGQKNIQIM